MNFKQLAISTTLLLALISSFAQTPKGEIKAGPLVHTAESSAGVVNEARLPFQLHWCKVLFIWAS